MSIMVALQYWGYCWHSFFPSNSTFLVHKSNLYRMPYRELFGFTHCFVSYISLYVYLCTMDIVHMREEVDIEKGLQTYNLRFSGSNTDSKQLIQLKLILHFHATWKSSSIVVFRGYSSWTLTEMGYDYLP